MQKIWGIHAGVNGDAVDLFLEESLIAMKMPLAGDLSGLSTRDEFKNRILETYAHDPVYSYKRSATHIGSVLFNFVHVLKPNDLVVFYAGSRFHYFIGQVVGGYYFVPSAFPHRRKVNWITSVAKSSCSRKFTNSMGSGVPLFSLDKHAQEIDGFLSKLVKADP